MLRIFVPQKLLGATTATFLVGWHNYRPDRSLDSHLTAFVWAAVSAENIYRFNRDVRVIGILNNCHEQYANQEQGTPSRSSLFDGKSPLFLTLQLTEGRSVVVCKVSVGGNEHSFAPEDCDIILFDPWEFQRLNELVLESNCVLRPENRRFGSGDDVEILTDDISLLHSSLNEFRRLPLPLPSCRFVVDFTRDSIRSPADKCQRIFIKCIAICIIYLSKFICHLVRISGLDCFVEKTSKYLNFTLQLRTRLLQLYYLRTFSTETSNLRCWNTISAVVIDVLLGFVLTGILLRVASADIVLEEFIFWTNFIVDNLHQLLHWLMGVPAGLKLNYALNYSMGTFFLFHIYLWQAYLYVMKPALEIMFNMSLYCGVFGLSCQLSVLQDLLSFATFHVYCFYAYAARIYNINFVGLASYWRVFRGKKWNPLRQRIDSCLYDADQLFMGTLCFTIFLFLLPTALMYYFVFLFLRLSVLIIQGIVYKTITLVNTFPLCTIVLFLLNSRLLVAHFRFSVIPQTDLDESTILAMNGGLCSFNTALTGFSPPTNDQESKLTWKAFFGNLLTGRLIYPI